MTNIRVAATLSLLLAAQQARAVSLQADTRILQGLDAAYSLDFTKAEELFTEASRQEPESPAGPFFLASLKWLEFSQNADIPGTVDALEPKFNQIMNQALRLANKMYAKNHDDPEANFFLGACYGMKGRWFLLERKWIRAARFGFKGYKFLKRTIELDPHYSDAYLGMGMYDYYSDTLPGVVKFAANLIVRGDKQRGLRYIETTLTKGRYSVVEAKLFMVAVLTGYEKQPAKAMGIIQELRMGKPDNLFFVLMEVVARISAKDWVGAIAFGEFLAPRARLNPITKSHTGIFDLYLGEAYQGNKDYAKALDVFDRCIDQAPEPRKATVAQCHLRRAQTLDLNHRRADALKDYAIVKKRPDFFDSQEKAKLGLKEPATYDVVLKQLME